VKRCRRAEIQQNAANILAVKSLKWQKPLMLFLLVAYSINLAWEFTHWHEVFFHASRWGIALGLVLRFVFLSLGIFYYLRLARRTRLNSE
jgi:hypothetical protein